MSAKVIFAVVSSSIFLASLFFQASQMEFSAAIKAPVPGPAATFCLALAFFGSSCFKVSEKVLGSTIRLPLQRKMPFRRHPPQRPQKKQRGSRRRKKKKPRKKGT